MSFDSILKKSFPFISAAASLGGPLGTMAAAIVGKALGIDKPSSKPEDLASVIATAMTDPAQRAALLKAEQDFQLQMAELGYKDREELESLAATDRANARDREIKVRDMTPKVIAGVIIAAAIMVESYCAYAVFHHQTFSSDGAIIIGRILGMLDSSIGLVVAYYFGSSAGSAAKTEIMAANGQSH